MAEKAILHDVTKCMACRGCQVACKSWNELRGEETPLAGTYENPPDLSPQTWMKIRFFEMADSAGNVQWRFTRQACMHCTQAACVQVCPEGANSYTEYGFVYFNRDVCIGCGKCVHHCPFEVPRVDHNNKKASRCIACLDRVVVGLTPACVKTCPSEALKIGDRSVMLALAQARVATLKSRYPAANVYGDTQLGGLHVIYVLDKNPIAYGLESNPKCSMATVLWQDIIQPLGIALGGLSVVGLVSGMFTTEASVGSKEG